MDARLKWAERLSRSLMAEHGLVGWGFSFFEYDPSSRHTGRCVFPDAWRAAEVQLAVGFVLANDDRTVRETILHEVAHALVGFQHGHDEVWRAKCEAIGGNAGEYCHAFSPDAAWVGRCPTCRLAFESQEEPTPLAGWHCPNCGPTSIFSWQKRIGEKIMSDVN